jgi:carboxyl-terminal processing protease
MSPRSRWLLFLVSTPLVLFVSIGGILSASGAPPQSGFPHLRVFNEVFARIINYYVEPVNVDDVMDGAMRGLTDALDPLSSYLSREEVQALEAKTPPPAGDTGLVIVRQFWLRVLGVRDGSPAARAGLRTGDFIRMIDGQATRDMSTYTGMRLLRGAPGTKVSLMVLRGTTVDPHLIDLVREPAPKTMTSSSRLPGGEGFVRVNSFGTGAAAAIRKEIDTLRGAGATGFIIDLRGVADGTPEEGIAAARHFVKTGTLATLVGRGPEKTPSSAAAGDGSITAPVVLLVSNGTTNGAEVFAAALQGNRRADLVGEPTMGLAAVQRLVKLPDNHGLWMTYGKYLGPDGNPIHERGLRPDVFIESPAVAFGDTPPTTDDQLVKATERLKSRK